MIRISKILLTAAAGAALAGAAVVASRTGSPAPAAPQAAGGTLAGLPNPNVCPVSSCSWEAMFQSAR